MADPRRTGTRRAVLSYSQLREMNPNWTDLMIKDYQGILQDFSFTADELDDLELRVEANEEAIVILDGRVDALESRIFRSVITSNSVTALSFQVILCTNTTPIEILLSPDAVKDDMIHIKRKDAQVTVNGLIDGDNTGRIINVKYWSELYIFDGTEWSVI